MLCALALSIALSGEKSCCGDMKVFLHDPTFAASHAAPLPLKFKAAAGKWVAFKAADGTLGHGFFVPANKGNKSAILMFHEWWGLNDYIKKEAEKLHNELGAAVFAVDMYDGKVATTQQDASKYMSAMNQAHGVALVRGALSAVRKGALAKATTIGTIGWCFGGGWSHRAAIEGGKDVQACVIYYGMPSTAPADLARLKAPVLMFWGKQDGFINAKVVGDFEVAMKKAGQPLKTHAFDAVHAFANPSNPKYDQAAAATSHTETLAFFRQRLK